MSAASGTDQLETRLLRTLQQLFELPALQLGDALTQASGLVADALGCDKVDAFLLDPSSHSLTAVGTSRTAMGRLQKELGLDFLPIANGGSTVEAFATGKGAVRASAQEFPDEVRGVIQDLGVRSIANVPLDVNGERRGVLSAASATPNFFDPSDLAFLEVVARWVGAITHRAELIEQGHRAQAEQARRAAAEEIVTVLAHDVRNHLGPLLGRLQLVRLKLGRGQPIDVHDVDSAVRSVQRLARLTSDLLDIGRLDHGLFVLNLAPTDLVVLVKEASAALSTTAVRVSLDVETPAELFVIADPDRLGQAIENVIANAVKHSHPGGVVTVRVSACGKDANCRAVVEVIDEGGGIAPELIPKLFERFASGHGSQGLGLGLYLANEIARAHGGALTVSSTPGRGACFRFELSADATPNTAS